jgi:hypothetical protein
MKATVRPRHAGWLAKHHCAHSAAMIGTIAPRHTMPQHGHKTMMTTMPRCAPQGGVTYRPS